MTASENFSFGCSGHHTFWGLAKPRPQPPDDVQCSMFNVRFVVANKSATPGLGDSPSCERSVLSKRFEAPQTAINYTACLAFFSIEAGLVIEVVLGFRNWRSGD